MGFNHAIPFLEERSDAACGVAWYAHGGGHGRPLGAMRIAMPSPQMPDCRGGVFAVFAKIPPPIPSPAAHPTEASIPCGDSRMAM